MVESRNKTAGAYMRVNLRELHDALDYMKSINEQDLRDIEWHLDGIPFKVPDDAIDEWRFAGLNNTYFAESYIFEGDKGE